MCCMTALNKETVKREQGTHTSKYWFQNGLRELLSVVDTNFSTVYGRHYKWTGEPEQASLR
jgi:hypothetical protein